MREAVIIFFLNKLKIVFKTNSISITGFNEAKISPVP